MKTSVTCPCGLVFEVTQARLDAGRGVYCSKPCFYRYRTRPSGLTYNIVAENPGWLKPGHTRTPTGEQNLQWKGDRVGYQELHRWVRRNKVKPAGCLCCGTTLKPLDWANLSHEYKRDLEDWVALCRPCHGHHDSGKDRGKAVQKYGAAALRGKRTLV